MFNSTSINGSPLSRNNKSTSPHFNNVSMITPYRHKRYSLADVSYTSTSYKNNTSGSRYTTSSPVLLNNQSPQRSINRMLSTQIDSKSPGLASRLVQYNKEKEQRSRPIIQSKYDKPGIFPIVHLFKKDVPVLKRKSNNTLSPSAADLSRHNSLEHNKKLLETIVYPGPSNSSKHENEVNTRSVLDALKEISRKRIHATENYHRNDDDDGKRMRIDSPDVPVYYKKRLREHSPQSEGSNSPKSPTAPALDEVTASHSSMIGQKIEPRITHFRKKKNLEKKKPVEEEKPKEATTKLVDVETQTVPEAIPPPISTISEKKDEEKKVEKEVAVVTPKKPPPMKIFDERPLEIMRRNRLSILMGLPVEKMESPSKILMREFGGENASEKSAEVDKPLVSILSGANKSPAKKHVSFDLISSSEEGQALSLPVKTTPSPTITQTSSSIVTPIVSAAITNLFNMDNNKKTEVARSAALPPPPSFSASVKTPEITTTAAAAPPTFNFTSNLTTSSIVLPFSLNTTSISSSQNETGKGNGFTVPQSLQPASTFGSFTSPPKTTVTPVVTSHEEKKTIGGFKFDLNAVSGTNFKPIATTTATNSSASTGGFTFNPIQMVGSPPNSFAAAKTTFSGFNSPVISTTTTSATPKSSSAFSVPAINFGGAIQSPNKAPGFSFGNSSSPAAAPSFGNNTSTAFGNAAAAATPTALNFAKTNLPAFNAITTTSAAIAPSFGGAQSSFTTGGGGFVNKPTASGFGVAKPISFGAVTTTTTTTAAVTSTAPPAFGSANLFELKPKASSAGSSSIFPASVFNASAPSFGASASPSLTQVPAGFNNANGNFGASIFNAPAATTASSAAPMFGAAAAAVAVTTSTFSTGSTMFGAKTSVAGFDNSIFGGGGGGAGNAFGNPAITATTTAASAFGSSGFGASSATSSLSNATAVTNSFNFGSTNAAPVKTTAFGSSSSSTFGSKGFGGGSAPQTSSVGFGAVSSASSGFAFRPAAVPTTTSNTFGSNNTPASAFPSPNPPAFGTSNASVNVNNNQAPPAFGSSQSSTFGSSNTLFGSSQQANAFGTSSAFGGNQTSAFNASSAAPAPTFGAASSSSGFGGFSGAAAKPSASSGEVFTFGGGSATSGANKTGAVFSFGGGNNNEAAAAPKSGFNFAAATASASNAQIGGGNTSFGGGFGGGIAPPAFGAAGAPSAAVAGSSGGGGGGGFGSVQQPGGMFSIGSGGSSTPTRSRTQIKAKRRT